MTDESGASAWASFSARHAAGDIVTVTVTKPLPFGCLVEATDGVPGLLRGVTGAHAGERVDARIESLDLDHHRVALVRA
jgi:hypothetical protein